MIIIGNKHIPHSVFINILCIDDISNTQSNSVVIFLYDIEIIKYCQKNNIQNAVIVNNITESIFCNNLDVDFIIVKNDISKQVQSIAQNYMFDSKILQIIKDDKDIQNIAINEIDGCIYDNLLNHPIKNSLNE